MDCLFPGFSFCKVGTLLCFFNPVDYPADECRKMFPGAPPAIAGFVIINTPMISGSQRKGFLKSSNFGASVS